MILLDTTIVSEVMKASPAGNVLTWLNEQDSDKLFVSAITTYGLGNP
jgi:predicted nucleic acid-binding protein